MTSSQPMLARLAGQPLAIAPRALDGLLAAALPMDAQSTLGSWAGARRMTIRRDADPMAPHGFTLTDSGIAVVPVLGPLVARGDWLSALFGAISYGEIGRAITGAFAGPSARAVLLELDSPGGEVGGLFDLVESIRALRAQTGKPLWSVASESALSAAYAIASAADRLYVSRTGEVGSIGVVAAHRDASGADAMAGLKWTLIHAGAKKVDGIAADQASAAAADRLRAEYAEIAAVAAQAARLGIAIDAAEAMRQGTKPDALRRSVLDALAARSAATAMVTAAPAPASAGDSPIVRRARERASALGTGPASRI